MTTARELEAEIEQSGRQLARQSKERSRTGRLPIAETQVEVTCAFCGGQGRDPFGLMSPLSVCQVCGGTGCRTLPAPTIRCAFCRGTGIHPALRVTCITCTGVGHVHVPAEAETCPGCGGTGREANHVWPDSPLSCVRCRGRGVIAIDDEQ
jgi:DnaJ-class molecular chaperone